MKTIHIFITLFLTFLVIACSKDDVPTATTPTPTTVTKSSAKDITKFSFAALSPVVDATIDATNKTISATVPAATDITKLVPTITISDKATVSPATGVAQDFLKEVSYTVTAEDGTTQDYKVAIKLDVIACKLLTIDDGTSAKQIYTYDAEGRIATLNREVQELNSEGDTLIAKYLLTFTYNNLGLLISTLYVKNDEPIAKENYSYTGSKITKVTTIPTLGVASISSITYDEAGRISVFSISTGNANNDGIYYFEYDSNGLLINRRLTDKKNYVFWEFKIKPIGKVKPAESVLIKHGLPYDMFFYDFWTLEDGSIGTEVEFFNRNNQGRLVSEIKYKITDLKLNAQGFVTEMTIVDDKKISYTTKYTFADCN
jgi:Domain of unknown function (DUF5018)